MKIYRIISHDDRRGNLKYEFSITDLNNVPYTRYINQKSHCVKIEYTTDISSYIRQIINSLKVKHE
jgi:hypothetical protein